MLDSFLAIKNNSSCHKHAKIGGRRVFVINYAVQEKKIGKTSSIDYTKSLNVQLEHLRIHVYEADS